jgi:hypothetical protein
MSAKLKSKDLPGQLTLFDVLKPGMDPKPGEIVVATKSKFPEHARRHVVAVDKESVTFMYDGKTTKITVPRQAWEAAL